MLNYSNLSDVEFEKLCQDIMERRLGVALHHFTPGRDSGIDLTDDVVEKSIVVQVKHYWKTPPSTLINALRSELTKVEKLNPDQYYICCSKELTPGNIASLYDTFHKYMDSPGNIMTLAEIEDFLHRKDNKDILQRHYKLWLDSTGILEDLLNNDIFVDCEVLLSDIKNEEKLFVKTTAFETALQLLSKNKALMIVGDPGVGKTITSKMIVLFYASQGYRVRYSTKGTDLSEIKKSLSRDPDVKEIILVDDCFGQAYFEMKGNQASEMLSLIKYVHLNRNKLLILNSRVTIYREASERNEDLAKSLNLNEYKLYTLDLTQLPLIEKAKILYNHLYFHDLPEEYFQAIKDNRNYWNIIRHRNYCPRIVEYVCSSNVYKTIPAAKFYDYFLENLNNPRKMWHNEYQYRLQKIDRLFLTTVYSLTNTYIDHDFAKRCFNYRISKIPEVDHTIDQFESTLSRLNEGFVKVLDVRGRKKLSLMNPSINDFLKAHLQSNSIEYDDLVKSICSMEQIARLFPNVPMQDMILNYFTVDNGFSLIFPDEETKTATTVWVIANKLICAEQYKETIEHYLLNPTDINIPGSSQISADTILRMLLSEKLSSYYGLIDFLLLEDNLERLFSSDVLLLEDAVDITMILYPQINEEYLHAFVQRLKPCLEQIIEYNYSEISAEEFDVSVNDVISRLRRVTLDGYDIDSYEIADEIDSEVSACAHQEMNKLLLKLPDDFYDLVSYAEEMNIMVSGSNDLAESYLEPDISDLMEFAPHEPSNFENEIDYLFWR